MAHVRAPFDAGIDGHPACFLFSDGGAAWRTVGELHPLDCIPIPTADALQVVVVAPAVFQNGSEFGLGPLMRDGVSDRDDPDAILTLAENWTSLVFSNRSVLRLGEAVWLIELERSAGGLPHRRVELALHKRRRNVKQEPTIWCPKPEARRLAAVRPEFDVGLQILAQMVERGSDKWARATEFELLAPQRWRVEGLCTGRDGRCPRSLTTNAAQAGDGPGDSQATTSAHQVLSEASSSVDSVDAPRVLNEASSSVGGVDAQCPKAGLYDCSTAHFLSEDMTSQHLVPQSHIALVLDLVRGERDNKEESQRIDSFVRDRANEATDLGFDQVTVWAQEGAGKLAQDVGGGLLGGLFGGVASSLGAGLVTGVIDLGVSQLPSAEHMLSENEATEFVLRSQCFWSFIRLLS